MISEVFNIDCMEYMRTVPDKFFELACVDPPYGIGNTTISKGNKKRKTKHKFVTWNNSIPLPEYFAELDRISKNQIIWGCNYYYPHIKVPGRIVHYKKPSHDLEKENGIKFCPCDLASQSFNSRIEYFEYNWFGNSQGGKPNFDNSGTDGRIHPTQKPIALYRWLLKKYANPGDKIFDSHMGSQSSRIAAYDMGFDYWGCELDPDYFTAGNKRFEQFKSQLKLPITQSQ